MPCHIVKTEPHFSQAKPAKHGFYVHELLGHAEKENPATFGIWGINGGDPVTCKDHSFHAFVALTEGEVWIEDLEKQTGPVILKAGDITHVTAGSSIRWGTPTKCKGIYVHLKPLGDSIFLDKLE